MTSGEKEILFEVMDYLNSAMDTMSDLEDDEAHADIWWAMKDITDDISKRVK